MPGKNWALASFLLGVMLVVGSCVPLVQDFIGYFSAEPMHSMGLEADGVERSRQIEFTEQTEIRVAAVLDISSKQAQPTTGSSPQAYTLLYEFPLRIQVRSLDGKVLFEQNDVLAGSGGQRIRRYQSVGQDGGRETVELRFEGVTVPAASKILIRASIGKDTRFGATLRHAEIRVYPELPDILGGVVLTIGIWSLGILAALLGLILFLKSASAAPTGTELDAGALAKASPDERSWALALHLSALVAYIGIPFGHVLAPLGIWLAKRQDSPFIDEQGKESLNFQLSVTLYGFISLLLCLVLIGFFLLLALFTFHVIFSIVAAVQAYRGKVYRYPLCIRLIR